MKDPKTNPPVFLNMLVGGRCDLNCPYCLSWRYDIPEMDSSHWEKLFNELGCWLPGRNVSLSGGEPLLHPEIEKIANAAGKAKLKPNICTSGGPFSMALIKALSKWPIEGLTVSLDGLEEMHDKLRGRKGLYQSILGGIDYLKELNPKMRIVSTTVISRHNVDQLRRLTEILIAKPQIDGVSFQAVISQSGPDRKWVPPYKLHHFPDKERAGRFLDWLLDIHKYTDKIKNSKKQIAVWKRYFESPTDVRSLMDTCHIGYYTLTVAPNGNVKLCDFHDSVGNVIEQEIQDIWHGEAAQRMRNKMKSCKMFCNYLINCGFEDFHMGLLNEREREEYFQSINPNRK